MMHGKNTVRRKRGFRLRYLFLLILIFLLGPSIANASFWTFKAMVEHHKPGKPVKIYEMSGWKSETQFLISQLPLPQDTEFEWTLDCGWDGQYLRWISVLNGTKENPYINQLSTNRYYTAWLDIAPVPRREEAPIQSITLALTPESTLSEFATAVTNRLLFNTTQHIPETYSRINISKDDDNRMQIIARAPNWLWRIQRPQRTKITMPEPWTNGFTNWIYEAQAVDSRNGFPTAYIFEKYFYNLPAEKDKSQPATILTDKVIARIEYFPASTPPPYWFPPLPLGTSRISDISQGPEFEADPAAQGMITTFRKSTNAEWGLVPINQIQHTAEFKRSIHARGSGLFGSYATYIRFLVILIVLLPLFPILRRKLFKPRMD
jgi:hypothetical protein